MHTKRLRLENLNDNPYYIITKFFSRRGGVELIFSFFRKKNEANACSYVKKV